MVLGIPHAQIQVPLASSMLTTYTYNFSVVSNYDTGIGIDLYANRYQEYFFKYVLKGCCVCCEVTKIVESLESLIS